MSQLDLALAADISQRHLSFIESGRSRPSRAVLINLAERLHIPLRARNPLLVSAGFAPFYSEGNAREQGAEGPLAAIETILRAHEPAPALVVDRHWNMVRANRAVAALIGEIDDPALLVGEINVLRLSLSPGGLGKRIVNYHEWRAHILERLRSQIEATGDHELATLYEELRHIPSPLPTSRKPDAVAPGLFVPFRIRSKEEVLTFISMTSVFGTPLDVELSELALETFLPADAETAAAMARLCGER